MFVWFAAGSAVIVWAVFQSPAIDYRMVMLGSVLPLVEVPFGAGFLQTLLAPCLALAVVMSATVGRRLVRRRLLGIPIGMFLHLVLVGAWMNTDVFWWPIGGGTLYDESSPVVAHGAWSVVLELAGIGLAVWAYRRFGLEDRARRDLFLRTGHLDRAFVPGERRVS
jgi:hypothetical protein